MSVAVAERRPFRTVSLLTLAAGVAAALAGDARGRRGAPGPEAGQRPAGPRRAAGHRLRHRPGRGAPGELTRAGLVRAAGVDGAGAVRGGVGRPRPTCSAWVGGRVRGDRARGAVRDRAAGPSRCSTGWCTASRTPARSPGRSAPWWTRCLAKDPADRPTASEPARPARRRPLGARVASPGTGRGDAARLLHAVRLSCERGLPADADAPDPGTRRPPPDAAGLGRRRHHAGLGAGRPGRCRWGR